jgi:uncharacterized protein DUF4328
MHPSVHPVAGHIQPTPLHGLSTAASGAVWVAAGGSILMAASTLTFGWYQASAQAQLGMVLLGGGLLLSLIGQAVAGILVIVWLTRARANADALYVARHRLAAGWAIGGWFIPIGNLFLPVVVVLDLVKASNPMGQSIPQVWMWWAGWIGGSIATPVGMALMLASDPLSRRGPASLALFLVLAAVLYTLAAIGFRSIAKNVANWQDEHTAQANHQQTPSM